MSSPKTAPGSIEDMEKASSAIEIELKTTENPEQTISTPPVAIALKPTGGFRSRFKSLGSLNIFKKKGPPSIVVQEDRKRQSTRSPIILHKNKPLGLYGRCTLKLKFFDEDSVVEIGTGILWILTTENGTCIQLKTDNRTDWNVKFYINGDSFVEEFQESNTNLFPCRGTQKKMQAKLFAKPDKILSGTKSVNEELHVQFEEESDNTKFIHQISNIIKDVKQEDVGLTAEAVTTDTIIKRPQTYRVLDPVFVHDSSSGPGLKKATIEEKNE